MIQPSLALALLTTAPHSINGLQVFFTTRELTTDYYSKTPNSPSGLYQLSSLNHKLETLALPVSLVSCTDLRLECKQTVKG